MSGQQLATAAALGAGSATSLAVLLMRQYLRHELQPPLLIHAPMDERQEEERWLLQEVLLLLRDYWPHPILEFSGYVSTIYSGFWAVMPSAHASGKMEVVPLADGGTVALHWYDPPQTDHGHVVLVLPGLNSDSRTSFCQSIMRHLRSEGFQAVALNYRGLAGQELRTHKVACADAFRDMPEVAEHLAKVKPGAELSAVGFSLGGAILLRHLGGEGAKTLFKSAVTIAAPFDMPAVSRSLVAGPRKRVTNFMMANGVKVLMMGALLKSKFREKVDLRGLATAVTLEQVDQAVICPLHGYKTAQDYYAAVDPRPWLDRIAIPTLTVNAVDDPVVSYSTLPLRETRRNPLIYAAITKRGGHIGWGSGGLGAAAWTDTMAAHFFQACSRRKSGAQAFPPPSFAELPSSL